MAENKRREGIRPRGTGQTTDPLVIQISPLHHVPDHDSSSLCLGTPEADILPVLERSRVSVTDVVTMFLIEASDDDIVYRSRVCAQLIPSISKSGKCDSCLGLIENIKNLEARCGEKKSEIKGEQVVLLQSQALEN